MKKSINLEVNPIENVWWSKKIKTNDYFRRAYLVWLVWIGKRKKKYLDLKWNERQYVNNRVWEFIFCSKLRWLQPDLGILDLEFFFSFRFLVFFVFWKKKNSRSNFNHSKAILIITIEIALVLQLLPDRRNAGK